jgi:hypothetical protein
MWVRDVIPDPEKASILGAGVDAFSILGQAFLWSSGCTRFSGTENILILVDVRGASMEVQLWLWMI